MSTTPTENISEVIMRLKDSIKRESAKALTDVDTYTAMVTAHPFAMHEDIERAIEVSRKAHDALTELKSAAVVATDNSVKGEGQPL